MQAIANDVAKDQMLAGRMPDRAFDELESVGEALEGGCRIENVE